MRDRFGSQASAFLEMILKKDLRVRLPQRAFEMQSLIQVQSAACSRSVPSASSSDQADLHVVMLAQIAQIPIQFLHPLLVRLDPFLLQPVVKLQRPKPIDLVPIRNGDLRRSRRTHHLPPPLLIPLFRFRLPCATRDLPILALLVFAF